MSVDSPQLDQPSPEGRTRVILTNDDRSVLTANQETDARTALTRGMSEYLEQLQIDMGEGRKFAFNHVFETWAGSEDDADYPSAAVYAELPGDYEASHLSTDEPSPQVAGVAEAQVRLVSVCELVLDFTIDVWATDSEMRMALVAMLEAALDPTDFRYGLLLELPHYFNQRASYEKLRMAYIDNEDSAQRRIRRAQIAIRGRVPVTQARTLVGTKPIRPSVKLA